LPIRRVELRNGLDPAHGVVFALWDEAYNLAGHTPAN
jgi:hypothetical protein